jgi:proteasome assembly chaperone (PAC2) family protein
VAFSRRTLSGVEAAESVPALVDPVMIAAFEGWNDAAEAASGVVEHLVSVWDAELVAEIDPEDYYDFQMNRPMVTGQGRGERVVTWPTTRLYVARPNGADHDVLLVRGLEPNMRWRAFCGELVDAADSAGVRMIVSLGALLADTPHTRPIPVTGVSSDTRMVEQLDVEASRYEGPTGINGVFQQEAARADIPSVSLWAAVPHYVAQPPCPKATLALIGRLEELVGVSVPLKGLVEEAQAWQRGVDELASEDVEISDYVESLEEARDTSDLPEASGEAIAREFERYLKRRDSDG